MATTQPTPDELARLAEQQAKFNAQLEKSKDLLVLHILSYNLSYFL